MKRKASAPLTVPEEASFDVDVVEEMGICDINISAAYFFWRNAS
jgi:hypothetical protein